MKDTGKKVSKTKSNNEREFIHEKSRINREKSRQFSIVSSQEKKIDKVINIEKKSNSFRAFQYTNDTPFYLN